MSLDIDWSLLSPSLLSSNLLETLNTQLASVSRPSFIGPITVQAFDFGSVPPDVEIKDIRDVWRAFDEGDAEGDEEDGLVQPQPQPPLASPLDDEPYEMIAHSDFDVRHARDLHDLRISRDLRDGPDIRGIEDEGVDDTSLYSLASPRHSVAAAGIGIGLSSSMNFARFSASGSRVGGTKTPSVFSVPLAPRAQPSTRAGARSHVPHPPDRHFSPPASPPARPAGHADPPSTSSIPSLQVHMRVAHASDLCLTLLTSLSINYPSPSFMSLPLKLSVTGLTLAADVILAYSGEKHRAHLCVIDDDPEGASGIPLGQRLLPNLTIESEIGHADAHVLKNVGKVERFIADVVRKTLVEELVFPNFQTIAL